MAVQKNKVNGALRQGEYRFQTRDNIADAVVKVRKQLGWKQVVLATEAGVTERTIQRLERGDQVSVDTLYKVRKALQLDKCDSITPHRDPSKTKRSKLSWSVAQTAAGLHGTPLGFGQFIRNLPRPTLQASCWDETIFLLIPRPRHAHRRWKSKCRN